MSPNSMPAQLPQRDRDDASRRGPIGRRSAPHDMFHEMTLRDAPPRSFALEIKIYQMSDASLPAHEFNSFPASRCSVLIRAKEESMRKV